MQPYACDAPVERDGQRPKRVAYLMSRFPAVTETFILDEIVELERLGLRIDVFPLIWEQEGVVHPRARPIVERSDQRRSRVRDLAAAQVYWLRHRPRAYLAAWCGALRGNRSSRAFLVRAVYVVPKAALIARQIEQRGIAHVHAHWATHPALAAWVVNRLTGLPYSVTAHAHDIYVDRSMLAEKLRAASFVVTIGEENRRLLRDLYGELAGRIVVVHCGVDPAAFAPPPSRPASEALQIACVASLRDYKGHPYLIDACARMAAQGVPFRCRLVGDGEDRPKIEALIRARGLADRVLLLGQQPRERVRALVAGADVVVLASVTTPTGKKDGIPVALMEALAAERAIVATDVSGIPELVEHERTGLLVPERDAGALAAALRRLYDDPDLRRRLGAAGRRKVLDEFDLRRTSARMYDLLARDWSRAGATRPAERLPAVDDAGTTVHAPPRELDAPALTAGKPGAA
jgi:glycosyltransferase involved in cell wall biosynthesis